VLTFNFAPVLAGDGEAAAFAAGEFAGAPALTGPGWFVLLPPQPARQTIDRTISGTDRSIFLPFEAYFGFQDYIRT
jgi:hypothetical protein